MNNDSHSDAHEVDTFGDTLSGLIKTHATRHKAPVELREHIHRALLQKEAYSGIERRAVPPTHAARWSQWFGLGAAFACGLIVSLAATQIYVQHAANLALQNELRSELLSSHLRSLMEAHLTDVASSERHTVRPWFTGKLDYAPPVYDFAAEGFPLVGGRLDYIGKRRVAALVYRAGLHTVNVFVWPDSDKASERLAFNGFNISHLSTAGMQFWAVSDLEAAQLDKLTGLIGSRLAQ